MSASLKPTLLRWTRFASDPDGTGGEKRTSQLTELMQDAGFTLAPIEPPAHVSRIGLRLAGLEARWRFGANASVDGAGIGLLGYRAVLYRTALDRHEGARVLSWETTYDDLLPAFAKGRGYRIVAAPHNLEALVSDQAFWDEKHDPSVALSAEVRRLARADAVFTISKEEQWFLCARGIAADYLPYFPCRAGQTECRIIRAERESRANCDGIVDGPLLLLGSAFNPATGRGMRKQLEWLSKLGERQPTVVVIGRDTDRQFASFASDRVQIRGTVTQLELVSAMKSASAVAVHTEGGAGALTRIPEALLAGLPIIANSNAARDQHGVAGVHVYHTAQEFAVLATSALPVPPAPPPPHAAQTRYVSAFLRGLENSPSSSCATQ